MDWHLAVAKDFLASLAGQNWPNGQWPTLANRPNANPALVLLPTGSGKTLYWVTSALICE